MTTSFLAVAEMQGIIDDIVLLGELVTIGWKERSRGVVEKTQQVNVMLRISNFRIELLPMVSDRYKLDDKLFEEE